MTVSLPRDMRYVATARLLAAQWARDAGCDGGPADAFAGRVEDVARSCLSSAPAKAHVTMAVEREPNALVVTIDHHIMRLAL